MNAKVILALALVGLLNVDTQGAKPESLEVTHTTARTTPAFPLKLSADRRYLIVIKETPGSAGGLPKFDSSGNGRRKGRRKLWMKGAPCDRLALERGPPLVGMGCRVAKDGPSLSRAGDD
jgi:hypothetical protein